MTPPIPGPDQGLNRAVAAELRAEQARQQLSVAELAERADIPYGSLRRYLNAERHIDVSVLQEIAKALTVEVSEIIDVASARATLDERTGPDDTILILPKAARSIPAKADPSSFDDADIAARGEDRGPTTDGGR